MYYRFRFISDTIQQTKEGWMISDLTFSFADLGSGVEELTSFDFVFGPNPSDGLIHLDCPISIQKAILSDLTGGITSTILLDNKKALNYSGLSKGLYFLQLESSDYRRSEVKRLIID